MQSASLGGYIDARHKRVRDWLQGKTRKPEHNSMRLTFRSPLFSNPGPMDSLKEANDDDFT